METLKRMFHRIKNKYIILLFLVAFTGIASLWLLDSAVVTVVATEKLSGSHLMFNGFWSMQVNQAYHLGLTVAGLTIALLVVLNLARRE